MEGVTDTVLWWTVCYGMQETEDSLEDWAESLTELSTMKTDLSQYIIADDVLLLQEQVEHLHRQWEELCLKVGPLLQPPPTCLCWASSCPQSSIFTLTTSTSV